MVVVDHYDSYTWNLVHLVAAVTGELPEVVEHDVAGLGDVLGYDRILLSPGPGHPADPQDFALGSDLLRDGSRPVLGVCLGMQGLVTAYGGRVDRVRPAHGEVAAVEHHHDSVFRGLPTPLTAVRYHSLAAVRVPAELAVTATCAGPEDATPVVMGVRHRELPLHGVQFHPESVLSEHGRALIANFLERP